jgi:hypothetical protein
VDVVQDLVVHFQRLKDLLIRVLQRQPGEVRGNLAPSCIVAASVRRSEEDDELRLIADYL